MEHGPIPFQWSALGNNQPKPKTELTSEPYSDVAGAHHQIAPYLFGSELSQVRVYVLLFRKFTVKTRHCNKTIKLI